jgi:hypothetical protein
MEEYGATVRIVSLPCPARYLPVWCSDLTDVVILSTRGRSFLGRIFIIVKLINIHPLKPCEETKKIRLWEEAGRSDFLPSKELLPSARF